MIDIHRLRLHLPAGFEGRAAAISRLVGEELGRHPIEGNRRLDSLSVQGVRIAPDHSDRGIAASIASAIVANLRRQAQAADTAGGTGW
jgi:hypothetical protein